MIDWKQFSRLFSHKCKAVSPLVTLGQQSLPQTDEGLQGVASLPSLGKRQWGRHTPFLNTLPRKWHKFESLHQNFFEIVKKIQKLITIMKDLPFIEINVQSVHYFIQFCLKALLVGSSLSLSLLHRWGNCPEDEEAAKGKAAVPDPEHRPRSPSPGPASNSNGPGPGEGWGLGCRRPGWPRGGPWPAVGDPIPAWGSPHPSWEPLSSLCSASMGHSATGSGGQWPPLCKEGSARPGQHRGLQVCPAPGLAGN